MNKLPLVKLRQEFEELLQENEPLAKYTSARIGGRADAFIVIRSSDQLAETVTRLWNFDVPFYILGGGSNILVSDNGVRQVVLLNKARKIRFEEDRDPPRVWAESGSNFGAIARQAAQKGLAGLEWAAGIPGTIGGAVYGNAGAHGGEMTSNLKLAEVLQQNHGRQRWTLAELEYTYRSSVLKQHAGQAVVLSATLELAIGEKKEIAKIMDENLAFRRTTQPPGASMGSMFKNPIDDHAGRLIDAVGLKGAKIGDAQISPLHANFFLNLGEARAEDVWSLIQNARQQVLDRFDIELELEVQLLGEWQEHL